MSGTPQSFGLRVGDHVRTESGLKGKIVAILGDKADVEFAGGTRAMIINFKLRELTKIEPPRKA